MNTIIVDEWSMASYSRRVEALLEIFNPAITKLPANDKCNRFNHVHKWPKMIIINAKLRVLQSLIVTTVITENALTPFGLK